MRLGYKLTSGRAVKPVPGDSTYIRWQDFLHLGQRDAGLIFSNHRPYERLIDPKACAVYLHSGGTTGEPRTIMLSSFNFNVLAIQGPQIVGYDLDQPFDPRGLSMVTILPLFHGFGLCMGLHTMLANGMRCIIVPQFTPEVLARVIIQEKPSFIVAVPTRFEGILRNPHLEKADLSCLKAVFCGGDTLTADLKMRFDRFIQERKAACTLREGYGLTETVTVCAVNPQIEARTDSVGLPLADVLMKVVDSQTLATLPPGQEGEFCVQPRRA
jgi:long-chain acyl-CoA synthetase